MEFELLPFVLQILTSIECSVVANRISKSESKEYIKKNQEIINKGEWSEEFAGSLIKDIESAIHVEGIGREAIIKTKLMEQEGLFQLHDKYLKCTETADRKIIKNEIIEKLAKILTPFIDENVHIDNVINKYFEVIDHGISRDQYKSNQLVSYRLEEIINFLFEHLATPNKSKDAKTFEDVVFVNWQNNIEQWHTEKKQYINRLFDNNIQVDNNILREIWSKFIENDNWKVLLNRKINELKNRSNSLNSFQPELQYFLSDHERLNYNTPLSNLKNDVVDLLNQYGKGIRNNLENSLDQLRKDNNDLEFDLHRYVLQSFKSYEYFITNNTFCNCLCFIGSVGSGKTASTICFIETAFEGSQYEDDVFFLPLNSFWSKSIFITISNAIRQLTGIHNIELDKILNYFKNNDSDRKLVIIIDDIGQLASEYPQFVYDLKSSIEYFSSYDNVKWLITLQENLYHVDNEEWNTLLPYAFLSTQNNDHLVLGNIWINLDIINRINSLGIELLREASSVGDNELLSIEFVDKIDEDDYYLKLFSNPYYAKIILTIADTYKIINLVDLSHSEISGKFYDIIVNRFLNYKSSFTKLGVNLILDVLLENKTSGFNSVALINKIAKTSIDVSEFEEKKVVREFLNTLCSKDLLSQRDTTDDGQFITSIKLIPFWANLIQKKIYNSFLAQLKNSDFIATDFEFTPINDNQLLVDNVTAQFLLQLDSSDDFSLKFIKSVWITSLESPKINNSIIFSALAHGSEIIQQKCVGHILHDENNFFKSKKDLFSFLYFVSHSRLKNKHCVWLLSICSDNFNLISKYNLCEYFIYILNDLLVNISDLNLIKQVILLLHGSEILDNSNRISSKVLSRIRELCSDDAEIVLDYVCENLNDFDLETDIEEEHYIRARQLFDFQHARIFRDWLLFDFLEFIISEYTSDSFNILKDKNWFDTDHPKKISRNLRFRMEKEATNKFGYFFRQNYQVNDPEKFKDYIINLVDYLCCSDNFDERRIGFYIIKHTIPMETSHYSQIFSGFIPHISSLLDNKSRNNFILKNIGNEKFCRNQIRLSKDK